MKITALSCVPSIAERKIAAKAWAVRIVLVLTMEPSFWAKGNKERPLPGLPLPQLSRTRNVVRRRQEGVQARLRCPVGQDHWRDDRGASLCGQRSYGLARREEGIAWHDGLQLASSPLLTWASSCQNDEQKILVFVYRVSLTIDDRLHSRHFSNNVALPDMISCNLHSASAYALRTIRVTMLCKK